MSLKISHNVYANVNYYHSVSGDGSRSNNRKNNFE
jgi:hypothetical protein